jgi:tRNA threonylcarbamoyl adenosine modification protein (Sua5/YciO/YrdC/YwlC family)
MIEYIVPNNIDDRLLSRGAAILAGGGVLAVPTDTSWSLVCSYKSREGIRRLKTIAPERDEPRFTLICSEISQIGDLCKLDNSRFRLVNRLTPGPYVFILPALHHTGKALNLQRREIGVRIPDNPVPGALVKALGQPLYAITAKRTMMQAGGYNEDEDAPEAEALFDGGWELEAIDGIDLILDTGEDQERILSTVLDMREDEVVVVREGAGRFPL